MKNSTVLMLMVGAAMLVGVQSAYIVAWTCTFPDKTYADGELVPVANDPECWECRCSVGENRNLTYCSNVHCPWKGPGK